MQGKKIIMVGPDLAGQGGVSRVVSIWRDAGFFDGYDFTYVYSCSDASNRKVLTLLKGIWRFVSLLANTGLVYIHSSAHTSFYRKSLFLLLAHLAGKKVILHIHPSGFYEFYAGLSGLSQGYARFVLGRVDTFVVLADDMKRKISMHFPHTPVHVLRNAVNLREMAYNTGIQRRTGELLYLGWYVRAKGVYELVDAIGLLKQRGISLHLNFYGTKEVDQLTEYVRGKHLTAAITVNGWIGGTEKLQALYGSSMLILPSHSEGIPNVILEAMATRTPIVATFVGGMKEILRDGENAVLVEVNNPIDLSEKICQLLEDNTLRNRLAGNAYQEAAEKYDVPVIRNCFREIIADACR